MTSEVAKQLKDAGYKFIHSSSPRAFMSVGIDGDSWDEPTLSELIDACGEKFDSLWLTSPGWDDKTQFGARAKHDWQVSAATKNSYALTPEEAVATLWLRLN